MISDQETSQQRMLKVAISIGVAAYVIIAAVVIGRAWIDSGRDVAAQASEPFDVVQRNAPSE